MRTGRKRRAIINRRAGPPHSMTLVHMKTAKILGLLCFAAILGILGATSITCGAGLIQGTSTWCGFHLMLLFGTPIAIPVALLFGFPAYLAYRRWNLTRWWMFAGGGLILAIPIWYLLVSPIGGDRWNHAGIYDSLNYLGAGVFAGLAFWWLLRGKANAH